MTMNVALLSNARIFNRKMDLDDTKYLDAPSPARNRCPMSVAIQTISTQECARWQDTLDVSGPHDFYHTAPYHALAEQNGEGSAVLLSWTGLTGRVALPLVLRPISPDLALAAENVRLCDASSVYGYAGPIGALAAPDEVKAFGTALANWLRERSVVSLFSRLHPLLDQTRLLGGLGEISILGPTVSIDLSLTPDQQVARYRNNHRRDLRKLRTAGFACRIADDGSAIDAWCQVYHETMHRVHAAEGYLFDHSYFQQLLQLPGLDLLLCEKDGHVCAGAIFSRYGAIAQYHLGGTADEYLSYAPMKLVFDELRVLALEARCSRLHLGGGLGAREDALFRFKAGFSPDRHDFPVWRWKVHEGLYDDLSDRAGCAPDESFFPAYGASVRR